MLSLAVTMLLTVAVQAQYYGPAAAPPAEVRFMNSPSMGARAPSLQKNVAFSMGGNKKFAEVPKYSAAGVPSPLNVNAKKTAEAYPIQIPEVGERPTDYASVKTNQGNPSAAFKAQHDDIGRYARPFAALLIGFFVGSAGTLAVFRLFGRGASTASEEPLLAVVD